MIFSWNFLEVKKLAKDYALMMQALKNTYLFVVSCEIKFATYIASWRLQKPVARGEASSVGVTSLQRQHLLLGARTKKRTEANHSSQ